MPDPKPNPELDPSGTHEVTLPMDLNLPENISANLPPLIVRIALPEEFFADSVKAK